MALARAERAKIVSSEGRSPMLAAPAPVPYAAIQRGIEADWFREHLDLDWPDADVAALAAMDEPKTCPNSMRSG